MYSFIQDWEPKKTLKGLVFRAPFSKGKITSLSLPEMPRGYTCVRARDIPGQSTLHCAGFTLPVLVDSLVRYLGEPVLLFCGPDSEVLAELAAAVRLSFEEDSRLEYADLSGPYPEGQTISVAQGDADLAFSLSDQIVEGEYHSGRLEHFYPDTQAALAEWDGKLLVVRTAAQDPFGLRSELARLLNLPERKVRVIAVHSGNTMEGKLLPALLVAAQAALLAFFAKKTVQLVYSREEDLRFTPKSPEFFIRHRTALDRDGVPLAARVEIHMDGGPYPQTNKQALNRAVQAAWGAYRLGNIEVTARSLVTDHPPVGNFRALGSAQAFFAAELHCSRLEEVAQLDPVRWKRANLAEMEAGRRYHREATAPAAVLEAVVGMSDFSRKHAAYSALKKRRKTIQHTTQPLRGIGLSLSCQAPEEALQSSWDDRSSFSLKVVLERKKRLRIGGSLTDGGLGIHELLVTRAAALLGLEAEKVVIEPADTGSVADTGPATLSWVAAVGLPLLEQCCHSIRKKRENASPPIEVRRSVSIRERRIHRRSEKAWAATVVEVELDPVTLRSRCRGIWLAVEAGGSWCEKTIVRVLEGESLRALGYACLRGFPHGPEGSGKPCTSLDLIPGPGELPPIHVHLLSGEDTVLKGFEHLPYLGVPPAYCAAVSQATGLYIDKVPATAEVIQQCLST